MERPVSFNDSMVQAIIEGRKTMTRLSIRKSHIEPWLDGLAFQVGLEEALRGLPWLPCPLGRPGDRLYVTEPWARAEVDGEPWYLYKFTPLWRGTSLAFRRFRWNHHAHMPREASRITLEITAVRAERLQSISEADAIADGITVLPLQSLDDPSAWYQSAPGMHQARSARDSFRACWDSRHQHPKGFRWEDNPWVWVVSFKVVKP